MPDLNCCWCGDDVASARWALGIRCCMACGETQAVKDRASWCVVQEYTKGNYQYVTAQSAQTTVKQTNQKQTREG